MDSQVPSERAPRFPSSHVCETTGIEINADLNVTRNIARRVGYKVPTPKKILSFIITTKYVPRGKLENAICALYLASIKEKLTKLINKVVEP